MKILVTGSSGFIGQALVGRLQAEGCEVAGLDRAPGATTNYVCDILDAPRLNDVVSGFSPDALVHLAARVDLDEKANLASYAANIEGVQKSDRRPSPHAVDQASDLDLVTARLPCRLYSRQRYRLHGRYALWQEQGPHRANRPRGRRRRTRVVPELALRPSGGPA